MITIIVGRPEKSLQGQRIDSFQKTFTEILDMVTTPSLFGDVETYIIENIFEDESREENFYEFLEAFQSAVHNVIILTDKLLAPQKKRIGNRAIIQEGVKIKSNDSSKDFNPFALANALAIGDKKKSWVLFHQVIARDDEIEKTHGMIWWKIKDMMTKRSVFSQDQLIAMARDLVTIYHESRKGGIGISERLEQFFITLPDIKK